MSVPTIMECKPRARSFSRYWGKMWAVVWGILWLGPLSYAQQLPPQVEEMGYADTIFINGKIVSMDDASTSTEVGNIYPALAVKRDIIMKLGTNQEVRTMAGRNTRILDLNGRTMIPGIIESHQHIYGASLRWLDRFGYKSPAREITVQAELDLERTQGVLRD
ncbi:MAG: hypothetical protein V3T61_06650, partial [Acidobacteriota bacterium]